MDGFEPYLSVVVTSRNDDHGGNLLRRMQIFVNGLIAQCTRHHLPAELIIVEWNPPADRPRLADALDWPQETGPCRVRIIAVPEKLHRRFRHSRELPLFQMIGKNVGIRRARGQFILATNIDLLFSDELLAYIADGQLERGRLYRIDRHDVPDSVPYPARGAEQLAYCQSHLLRVNARDGTFPLTLEGELALAAQDIVADDQELLFGEGWFPPEIHNGVTIRWAGADAVLKVGSRQELPRTICLDIEPGPGVGYRPFVLEVLAEDDAVVARGLVKDRALVAFRLPQPGRPIERFRLRSEKGGRPTPFDWRMLNFRAFGCRRLAAGTREISSAPPELAFQARPVPLTCRGALEPNDVAVPELGIRFGPGWHNVEEWQGQRFRWASNDAVLVFDPPFLTDTLTLALEPGPGVAYRPFELQVRDQASRIIGSHTIAGESLTTLRFPVGGNRPRAFVLHVAGGGSASPVDARLLNFRLFGPVRSGRPLFPWSARNLARKAARLFAPLIGDVTARRRARLLAANGTLEIAYPRALHLNAAGDFTLMAREHWLDLQGYPEFEMYSLHIDSLFCYQAVHSGISEAILREPLRIYHIEHGVGSGWTPEGAGKLHERLTAKRIPMLDPGQVMRWATQMQKQNAPLAFNRQDWGLAQETLKEVRPGSDAPGRRRPGHFAATVAAGHGGHRQ